MVTAGIAFAVVFAIVFVPYWILVDRTEEREDRALKKRLKVRRTKAFSPAIVKAQAKLSSVEQFAAALIRGRSLFEPFARTIRQSGLNLTVGTIVLACGFIAVVAFFLTSRLVPSVWLAVAVAALSGSLPVLYVRRAARKRMEAFEEQFPEAIDLIARGLRAGHALTTTLQMVGDEVPDPVGAEFRLLFEQQNYGMSLGDALKAFADRFPIIDARFFVTALLTQREMGGNLSEVLDNLASVIRERFKVKRQVRVVSAHARITGIVLGFLPPVVALVLFFLSPSLLRLLIDDPLGVQMIIAGVVLQVVGVLAIRRIVNVEY
jgi:tight adherence protein B